MPQFLLAFQNLDLLSVGIAVAGMVILGFVVLLTNFRSASNRIFFCLAMSASVWGVVNYASYQIQSLEISFWLLRFVMFFGVWSAFFIFVLAYVFPSDDIKLPRNDRWVLFSLTTIISLLTLTPLVFYGISEINERGQISRVINGPGILLFGLIITFFNVGGVVLLIQRIIKSKRTLRKPLLIVLFGIFIMLSLIMVFNFILPAFFDNSKFIPFGALFLFPFIAFTAYAILKHKFFNIKIASIALLVFALSVVTFGEIIFSREISLVVYRSSIFLFVLIFGILLMKGVLREVKSREKIEKQEKELEIINTKLSTANEKLKELDKQKSEFVSFASHQLRSPLTAIKGYASLILEGDYGQISDDLKHASQIIFDSANTLVTVVSDYLNVTSIELGKMRYDFTNFDLKDLVRSVMDELKQNAEKATLKLSFECDTTKSYPIKADREKLKQVLVNIIDNSIKYTPKGEVKVSLSKDSSGKILFAVKDTGIGISKETISKLFSKFTRAKNANETNIRGTGLGLFIAKEIINAHSGKIWVESGGEGSGSQFYVELTEIRS